jgi:hypothetical protein
VRRATVTLSGEQPPSRWSVTSDAQGRFQFDGVPPGDYTLTAGKPGFIDMAFGARRAGRGVAGNPIRVAAGQRIDGIAMRLPRGGVISGIVTDEFGDPAFGVPMRALRLGYGSGARMATTAATGATDDLGGYRLAGLLPGEYIISAVPRDAVAALASTQASLQERMAQTGQRGTPINRNETAPLDPVGYVPVYFGGTASPSAATRVTVGVGQQVGSVDLQLQSIRTATIRGTVASTDGAVVSANVHLVDPAMPIVTLGAWFRNSTPGGKFSFAGLPPGNYVVTAKATVAGVPVSGTVNVPVEGNVVDVAITLRRGVTVSGAIDLTTVKEPVDVRRLRVRLEPVPSAGDWELEPYEGTLDTEGRFAVPNVTPALYRVAIIGLPPGGWLDSASFDARDAADLHLRVAGDAIAGGVFTLSSQASDVTGVVATADGSPADRTVVLFPAERAHWLPQARRIHVMQTSPDGRYAIRNLRPGEYLVAAVDGVEAGEQFDPAFLQRHAAGAVRVTLAAGTPGVVNLKVR